MVFSRYMHTRQYTLFLVVVSSNLQTSTFVDVCTFVSLERLYDCTTHMRENTKTNNNVSYQEIYFILIINV